MTVAGPPVDVAGSPGESLGRKVRRGAAWSTAEVAVARLGQFATTAVIARLLDPKDFGVFAVALVVHAIVVNISELGVSAALIRDDDDRATRGAPTVATIAIASSLVLGGLMALSAPLLARLLGSPAASGSLAVMALTLPLAGMAAVPAAFLRRHFRMDRLFLASAANMVATAVIVIPLAIAGWGPMALAWSWVAGQLLTSVIIMTYEPGRFRPGWDRNEAGRLVRFGLPLAGANILAFAVLNVDNVVVARMLTPEALGLYVMAFNISGWPMNVFGAVVRSISLPGFSHLQRDGASMPEHYTRSLGTVATLTLPVCAILGGLAVPVVTAVYGEKWVGAAAALTGLCVLGGARILIELTADFLVTLGRTRAVLLAQVPWLIGLVAALVLLVHGHGIAGAGVAQAGIAVGLMVPIYLVLLRRAGVSPMSVARVVLPPLFWALLAAGVAWFVASHLSNPFIATAAGTAAGSLCYLAAHTGDLRLAIATVRRERAGSHPDEDLDQDAPAREELADRLDEADVLATTSIIPGLPADTVIGPT
ncbi:MAG: lipopolysaccharide biosynthesis protein [Acidimicrobiales bacterium]